MSIRIYIQPTYIKILFKGTKCVHCREVHLANYRGYIVAKKFQKNRKQANEEAQLASATPSG